MVNRYSWHKLGAKGVCGLAERLNAYFWMKLVAQRGTITQTPLCAKFVPEWRMLIVCGLADCIWIVRLHNFGTKGIITPDPPL